MAFPGNSNNFDKWLAEINAEAETKRILNHENINTNVNIETPEQSAHRLFLKRIIYNEDQPYDNVQSYYDLLLSIYKNKDVELIKRLAKVTNYKWGPGCSYNKITSYLFFIRFIYISNS